MKNQEIKIVSMGCRLNALESEKIRKMLMDSGLKSGVIINTCAVTNEASRQSRQTFHKIQRENSNVPIFITGCGATLLPEDFISDNAKVILNKDKFNPSAYGVESNSNSPVVDSYEKMQTKGFVQIGDGCDHGCTYCITRILRGRAVHFSYDQILRDAKALLDNKYEEIILTGVNIADYKFEDINDLTSLCKKLLNDLPQMKILTLSSLDPASDIESLIDLIRIEPRMSRHLHLSVQSGSDPILKQMARRHNQDRIRQITEYGKNLCTFSWDIICGFPGETESLFNDTLMLANELKPTKIHAFPFSARPGTVAAKMPNQITRVESKKRVNKLTLQ